MTLMTLILFQNIHKMYRSFGNNSFADDDESLESVVDVSSEVDVKAVLATLVNERKDDESVILNSQDEAAATNAD